MSRRNPYETRAEITAAKERSKSRFNYCLIGTYVTATLVSLALLIFAVVEKSALWALPLAFFLAFISLPICFGFIAALVSVSEYCYCGAYGDEILEIDERRAKLWHRLKCGSEDEVDKERAESIEETP